MLIVTAKYLATLPDHNVHDNKTKNDLHRVKKGSLKLDVGDVSLPYLTEQSVVGCQLLDSTQLVSEINTLCCLVQHCSPAPEGDRDTV